MLIFFIICAFLQTPRGASVAPHAYNSVTTSDMLTHMAREPAVAPNDEGQQLRTVYSIVKSCLLTIFACVWKSAHPNINGPRDSWWTRTKRKLITMLYAVITPELMLLWALNQRQAAKVIAERYNKEFAIIEKTQISFWGKVVGLFRPLPEETTWRGEGQSWTVTHGFFIQMGGFILYNNGRPKEVLDYQLLMKLLREKAIDPPTVTERELQDRSKGDTISKAIIVTQTTWFVLQGIARVAQRLPLSELEVLTLAFAVVNVAIYAVWWNKPQGVDTAICVRLKTEEQGTTVSSTGSVGEEPHDLESLSHPEPSIISHADYRHSNDSLPLIPPHEQGNISTGEKHSWLRRKLRQDREQHSLPFFLLFRLPYRIILSVLHSLNKMGEDIEFRKKDLRVPMFYAVTQMTVDNSITAMVASVIGIIFGAIHLLAWAAEFPSHRDTVLWRISAIVMTVEPLLLLVALATEIHVFWVLLFFVAPVYVAARFVLLFVAVLAIHDPPRGVLLDISWTSHIPHF
ncbi:hypothetical protein D9619_010536 [Psilocybe cf. subviscida]|uniref:Uncharacterized protein n=1 Tax=Psilocybe cf. subviscida TaxID=2480587 RepID=A0A8H5ASI8_9AGAR|nr:hypothetical protein D9619_010536 [Psilocybe cf. subviscida]